MYQEIRKLSYVLIALLVLLGGLFAFQKDGAQAAAGINKRVNFQGKVTNTDGTNVATASYNFLFCIYTTATPVTACTAGANNDAVWRESKSLTVTDGIFQTNLGDTTAFAALVDFNSDNIYLGINFNTNGQMTPLVQFTASPYSFNTDLLDGGDWAVPGALGSTTRNSALFTTLGSNGSTTLASTGGSIMTLGNSTGAATVASGGTSSWTNTSGNLTFSTSTSGILALTSAGALNLSAASASTATLSNTTNAFNFDSNTLSIDALNNRIGIGTAGPTAFLDITAPTTSSASLRLQASTAVDPSAPNIGDMWFNGTNLYFRKNGSTSQDLLASAGGGYSTIFDDVNNTLTQRNTLAFLGTGINCADNAGRTECTVNSGGAGPWTDGTGVSYLTDTTEDLAIGGSTLASPFSVDVSTNTIRVGSGATANGNVNMYASNGNTGKIEYTTNDSFNLTGGNFGINNSNPDELMAVGSRTSRGDLGVYGDITSEGFDIQRTLAGIIDIFVYDTSRDSDGGEWRNSTYSQQLSWATETIDNTGVNCVIATDDRCGKNIFPRKAIIATTADAMYIFDGADNSLWMKFTQAGTYAMGADLNNNPSGVGAQNGVIVVGTNGSAGSGMYAFDFKLDAMFRYNATNRVQADKNIGNRNTVVTYATDANTGMAIADNIVNDVSIAMITSSTEGMLNTLTLPIDSATGPMRGMTLIAAANDTAVSVVNMASRKTLSYSNVAGSDYNQVVITSRARMYATNETQQQLEEWRNIDRDVASELAGTPDKIYDETLNTVAGTPKAPITTGTAPTISTSPGALTVLERASSARESAATTLLETGDVVYLGTNQGLAEVHTSGGNLVGASWSKLTTTTVATPYMIGSPQAVYSFDEAAGATAAASAIGAAGTTNNPMDSAVTATAPTFGTNGVRGKSVTFNNNSMLCSDANGDGTCDSDTNFNAGTTSFTVSLWFKHSVTAAADTLFERCYTPATPTATINCIYAGMHTTGQIRFAINSLTTAFTYNTTYNDNLLSTASYNDNQWHHAVFTNTDTDVCMYIDGKQAVGCDTTIGATATMDAAQVLTIGGTCAGAACVTGANFWDGSIDDFVWSSNGGTTADGLPAQGANKLYLDGRAHLIRPSTTVTNATAYSATTIGSSTEAYIPNSFAGLVVELTGGTGIGQTRTIISNDATTFTVYPAFATTPDATTNYKVSPAKLFGSSNNVTAVAVDGPTNLNKVRKVFVGTNDGADGGGVSIFTNAGTGSIKTDVMHSDAGIPADDLGSTWSGTGADNISSIGAYSDTTAFGSAAFQRSSRKEISLKQLQLDTTSALEDIRQELVSKQLFGSTQDVLGLGQGADLAEYYNSNEPLEAGTIIATGDGAANEIKKTTTAYQKDVMGVVATKPSMIMGPKEDSSYPVALSGRVPVKVTTENGNIMKGDQITTSSLAGYGMVAIESGRVIGMALETPDASTFVDCPVETGLQASTKCGEVVVFVNLNDFSGMEVEDLMSKKGYDMLSRNSDFSNIFSKAISQDTTVENSSDVFQSQWTNIFKAANTLGFLNKLNDPATGMSMSSEILAKNINASDSVVSPLIMTDTLVAKHIKAETIEGLEFIQTGIDSANNATEANTSQVKNLGQQLSELQSSVKNLSEQNKNVDENIQVVQGLSVQKDAEFKGLTIFKSMVSFIDRVIFRNKVEFEGQVTFNKDSAGFAIIKEGTDSVGIEFENEYSFIPVINASLSLQSIENDEVRKASEELLLVSDVKFIITNITTKGFEIRISQKAISDIPFSWQTIAVRNAKTFESKIPMLASDKKEVFQEAKNETPVAETSSPVSENTILTEEPQTQLIENAVTESGSENIQIAGLEIVR